MCFLYLSVYSLISLPRRSVGVDVFISNLWTELAYKRYFSSINFTDQAALSSIKRECFDSRFPVPNIVHFVWFSNNTDMQFHHMVSMLSAMKFIKPCRLLIHGDRLPTGPWWRHLVARIDTSKLVHVYSKPPSDVFGHPLVYKEYSSDIHRLTVLWRK